MAPSSTTTSSSSVVPLTAEDLLDTADSATVDDERSRWPGAAEIKSTFVVDQILHSGMYHIPKGYTLLNPKDWVACDVPSEGYYNAICVYATAFEAGMRLPLHDFYVEVLGHYGLAPSQLMPNAWRYLSAFVLLCQDAGVEPMLPVFMSFFVLCVDKGGPSTGRYHFRPYLPSRPDLGSSSSRRLFKGRIRHSPMWKDRFFFIRAPSTMPWPCSLKWGTPRPASIKKAMVTKDTAEAIRKLVHLAGDTGIDIIRFLSVHKHNPPVGHLHIPAVATRQHVAVKAEEATAGAAAWTEPTRKRKSPEPITCLPPLSPPAPSGVGLGRHAEAEPRVTGGERSRIQMLVQLAQEAVVEYDTMKQQLLALREELQTLRSERAAEAAQHKEVLAAAKAKHAADVAQLENVVKKAKAEAIRSAEKLQKAQVEHAAKVRHITAMYHRERIELQRKSSSLLGEFYNKGVRDTKELVLNLYGDTLDLSEFTNTNLMSDSTLPLGLAPQPPEDD